MKLNTQKNFILQLGALIALYISVTTLIVLIFSVTNLRFPDEAAGYWESESARVAVRNTIAMLVVFFPAFLVFTRLSNQDRRKYSQGEYATFAKWLVYLTILGGVLILLGDLVTLIMFFLNGEITTRFIIKVAALLLVVGGALSYYVLDVKGYFKNKVSKSLYFGLGALVLVIISLVYGYSYIETPAEVRQMRLDTKQITDLQEMYWHVEDYYRQTDVLPEAIDAAYPQTSVPTAPEERASYTYAVLNETQFELCATFAVKSDMSGNTAARPVPDYDTKPLYENQNWEHGDGDVCFTRTVRENIIE